MTFPRGLPGLTVVSLIIGYSTPSGPSPDALVGEWRTDVESLSPRGTMVNELSFTAAGRFASEVPSFGIYQNQGADELSAEAELFGRRDAFWRVA